MRLSVRALQINLGAQGWRRNIKTLTPYLRTNEDPSFSSEVTAAKGASPLYNPINTTSAAEGLNWWLQNPLTRHIFDLVAVDYG